MPQQKTTIQLELTKTQKAHAPTAWVPGAATGRVVNMLELRSAHRLADEHELTALRAHGVFSRKEQTMKQRFCGFSLLVTALAALALGGPARAGEQVPFKGRSSGVVTVVAFDPFSARVEGEGQATHLGRFTLTADLTADATTGNAIGAWTLTAANGDMLFATFTSYGIDPTHGHGDFTIVGGTGRFQGATGSYTQLIAFGGDLGGDPFVPYTDVLEGTISSPGSNK